MDNIATEIDYELVRGLVRDQALQNVLYKGLGVSEPDASSKCAEYFKESPETETRRRQLKEKRARLEAAKMRLTESHGQFNPSMS